jgi:sugar (pentulose or hexulose) kinase
VLWCELFAQQCCGVHVRVLLASHPMQGNRTPHTDASARGGLVGLTLKHTLAHVYRATLEGVAFGTELVLETMRQAGFEPEALTVAGVCVVSDRSLKTGRGGGHRLGQALADWSKGG